MSASYPVAIATVKPDGDSQSLGSVVCSFIALCRDYCLCCKGGPRVSTVNQYTGAGHYIRPLPPLTGVQRQEREGTDKNVSYQFLKPSFLLISLKDR